MKCSQYSITLAILPQAQRGFVAVISTSVYRLCRVSTVAT